MNVQGKISKKHFHSQISLSIYIGACEIAQNELIWYVARCIIGHIYIYIYEGFFILSKVKTLLICYSINMQLTRSRYKMRFLGKYIFIMNCWVTESLWNTNDGILRTELPFNPSTFHAKGLQLPWCSGMLGSGSSSCCATDVPHIDKTAAAFYG